ncbi:hypothetical protein C8R44DRAFT_754855 [Mycena epipterygia]|nr:hypothetical protein C8R44DRAFT_754855 [Mycena epipterygia]
MCWVKTAAKPMLRLNQVGIWKQSCDIGDDPVALEASRVHSPTRNTNHGRQGRHIKTRALPLVGTTAGVPKAFHIPPSVVTTGTGYTVLDPAETITARQALRCPWIQGIKPWRLVESDQDVGHITPIHLNKIWGRRRPEWVNRNTIGIAASASGRALSIAHVGFEGRILAFITVIQEEQI